MKIGIDSLKWAMGLLLLSLILAASAVSAAPTARSAYKLDVHHYSYPSWCNWSWCAEPHYGAYFSGAYGQQGSAYFTGLSGSYPGYSNNGWVGSQYNVMLISKTWLLTPACTYGNQQDVCADRWQSWNHWANLAW